MQLAMYLRRPVFEILSFPETELEYWSCYFSIQNNNDEPILSEEERRKKEIDDCVAGFEKLFG